MKPVNFGLVMENKLVLESVDNTLIERQTGPLDRAGLFVVRRVFERQIRGHIQLRTLWLKQELVVKKELHLV